MIPVRATVKSRASVAKLRKGEKGLHRLLANPAIRVRRSLYSSIRRSAGSRSEKEESPHIDIDRIYTPKLT